MKKFKISLFFTVLFISILHLNIFSELAGEKIKSNLFQNVKKVVFINSSGLKDKKFIVKNREKILEIIKTIKLEPKELCDCLHHWEIIFSKKRENINVSVCSHCFNIHDKKYKKIKGFKMPKKFHGLFLKHTQQNDNKNK